MFDRLLMEPVYNTRAVALKTGVPADTFRAWERRYNLPIPCRSEGNQRLYCERDVAIISWLRDQTRSGMTISHAVALFMSMDRDDQNRVANSNAESPSSTDDTDSTPMSNPKESTEAPHPQRMSYFQACLSLIDALKRFDAPLAEQIVEQMTAATSIDLVCHEVLLPTINEIRERHDRDEISGSVERFANAFVKRKVNALFSLSHPESGRGPVVAAGVEGEHDELDLLCLSLSLSSSGFSVVYLGSNITAPALQEAIHALKPLLVLLNANSEATTGALERAVQSLHTADSQAGSPLVGFTGSVFERLPELKRAIDAPYFGCDGVQAVATCDRLTRRILAQ